MIHTGKKTTAKNRNANLTREEQKSINSMFKDSLTLINSKHLVHVNRETL